ncbi:MAG: acyl-phosphate glycerol 3-phosphate acyltransferase, partial [Planctomycetota bacterium]|nr:acyl-phosphate glycerol 3-phosphate acyltransferase [Planctomycetota bacterium]
RYMSLSSMLAAVAFAIAQCVLLRPTPWAEGHWSLGLFSLLVPALIVFRHRGNIGRLLRGEESKFRAAKSE